MDQPSFFQILVNWFPMIVYLGFWAYFIHKYNTHHREIMRLNTDMLSQSQRQADAVERIAAELAKPR